MGYCVRPRIKGFARRLIWFPFPRSPYQSLIQCPIMNLHFGTPSFLACRTLDVDTSNCNFVFSLTQHYPPSGQEEYERLRPLSYSKSHVILIAFAIDTPDSLENVLNKWNEEVLSICGPSVPILLVGLKSDLRPPPAHPDIRNYVSRASAAHVAQEIGPRAYTSCFARKIH